jgi:hypothetical protein
MKNSKSLSGFEPTVVRGKWFEVNDLNHSATDAPLGLFETMGRKNILQIYILFIGVKHN